MIEFPPLEHSLAALLLPSLTGNAATALPLEAAVGISSFDSNGVTLKGDAVVAAVVGALDFALHGVGCHLP